MAVQSRQAERHFNQSEESQKKSQVRSGQEKQAKSPVRGDITVIQRRQQQRQRLHRHTTSIRTGFCSGAWANAVEEEGGEEEEGEGEEKDQPPRGPRGGGAIHLSPPHLWGDGRGADFLRNEDEEKGDEIIEFFKNNGGRI